MLSTLFLNKITVIDHATIDGFGRIVGGSMNLSCHVTGKVIGDESVVVDFSRIKKDIKNLIDDSDNGYDHKLWVIHDMSLFNRCEVLDGRVYIETPTCKLDLPVDAYKEIESHGEMVFDNIIADIEHFLDVGLNGLYPDLEISVKCFVDFDPMTLKSGYDWHRVILFRYCHGLKHSSSYGCQNLVHGHLSFVELLDVNCDSVSIKSIDEDFSKINYLFVNEDNVVKSEVEGWVKVQYETPRGLFCAEYKEDEYEIVYFPTETTVEHLVDWFVEEYENELVQNGVEYVMMSEGLTKGSLIQTSCLHSSVSCQSPN